MDVRFKVQGGRIVRDIERPTAHAVASVARFSTSLVSDCLERLNVMHPDLRPLGAAGSFVGTAVTVEEIEAGNLMSHMALTLVKPGDVLVIDGKGITTRACFGGLQALAAKLKGVAGVVIDGAVRDVEEIRRLGLPVVARGTSPAGPHKGWGGRINQPISCGGVPVAPGDVVLGDADGVVVIPRGRVEEIAEAAFAKQALEAAWLDRVKRGEDTAEFLGFVDVAKAYGVEIV